MLPRGRAPCSGCSRASVGDGSPARPRRQPISTRSSSIEDRQRQQRGVDLCGCGTACGVQHHRCIHGSDRLHLAPPMRRAPSFRTCSRASSTISWAHKKVQGRHRLSRASTTAEPGDGTRRDRWGPAAGPGRAAPRAARGDWIRRTTRKSYIKRTCNSQPRSYPELQHVTAGDRPGARNDRERRRRWGELILSQQAIGPPVRGATRRAREPARRWQYCGRPAIAGPLRRNSARRRRDAQQPRADRRGGQHPIWIVVARMSSRWPR